MTEIKDFPTQPLFRLGKDKKLSTAFGTMIRTRFKHGSEQLVEGGIFIKHKFKDSLILDAVLIDCGFENCEIVNCIEIQEGK